MLRVLSWLLKPQWWFSWVPPVWTDTQESLGDQFLQLLACDKVGAYTEK